MIHILIIGSGGREHALAWKLSQSPNCGELYIAPGNAGTKQYGTNVPLDVSDFKGIAEFCLDKKVEMLVVGPEAPLVDGIVDYFRKEERLHHINVVGPSAYGAQLEGSKAFAKKFMERMNIPTASYREFNGDQVEEGVEYLATHDLPIVLKADGLAAGKGVVICNDVAEAQEEFRQMLGGKFGSAGSKVVIEAFLDGIEFSVFALTDGKDYVILPVAKDYKRIGEGDTGLNTGGMGAVSPPPFVNDALMQKVEKKIIQPTIDGLKNEGIDYKGFVFFGLIRVEDEPFVIEYNCRLGDPETEVVLPRLKNDLVSMFDAMNTGKLNNLQIVEEERAATTIMLVSGGYPEKYEKGKPIHGLEGITNSILFHAGTKEEGEQILTNGGRVLAITSYGTDYRDALSISNNNAEKITFEGKNYRKDIGFDLK